MAMQITERGKWIELVRTEYVTAEVVVLQDGTRAYKVGTGRSKRGWHGKFPAASETLPPDIAKELEPGEQQKVKAWLGHRAERRRLDERILAKTDVARIMALAAEGYADEKIPRGVGREIWGAWKLLRAALQRSGIQEREDLKNEAEPPPSPPKRTRSRGGSGPGADSEQS